MPFPSEPGAPERRSAEKISLRTSSLVVGGVLGITLCEGGALGDLLGRSDAPSLGILLTAWLGTCEGDSLWWWLGILLGANETEGLEEITLVGNAEGLSDRESEGAADGRFDLEGAEE